MFGEIMSVVIVVALRADDSDVLGGGASKIKAGDEVSRKLIYLIERCFRGGVLEGEGPIMRAVDVDWLRRHGVSS